MDFKVDVLSLDKYLRIIYEYDKMLSASSASDFGKEVTEVYKDVKKYVEGRPDKSTNSTQGIDRQVREEIISDLDHLIKKNESR